MNLTLAYTNRPLVRKLVQFKEENPVSLHVPGHKNGLLSGLPPDFRLALGYDFTELEGLDDLHEPNGVIEEAEQRLSILYNTRKSFFLVNGSTVGNLAMVYATCRAGETVVVQRNAHKSIFNAIELTGAIPVFIAPEWDSYTRTAGIVTRKQVERALESYPQAKAVILTYPSYYGSTGDELESIIQLCHSTKIPVLVDEAHGAHFVVGEPFPRSALAMGADIVVHSAHKTLPAMTMASFLHVQSSFISSEKVSHYLKMLQSSSPSYLLMASLDDARAYAEEFNGEDKESFLAKRQVVINRLGQIGRIQTIMTDDPLKLIVRLEGYSGFELQKEFEKEGVYAELADPYQVLFILPLLKKEHNYLFEEIAEKIENAVKRLSMLNKLANSIELPMLHNDITELSYIASEIEQFETEWILFKGATGKVVADSIVPYPPGIPLLLKGERVTEGHLQLLSVYLKMGARFHGGIRVNEEKIIVLIDEVEE